MTDILERINDLNRKKQELQKESDKLKREFSSYISNKDIPLHQRWKTFCKAPDELSNHERYLINARTKGLQYIKDNWFDAPEVYGRGKKISTKEMFDRVFSTHDLKYSKQDYTEKEIALYKEAMEDVLSQNCASFCFDW